MCAFLIPLFYILSFLDRRDRRRISGRAADAEFFQLLYKRCLCVSWLRAAETLRCSKLGKRQRLPDRHRRKQAFSRFLRFIFVLSFAINFQKAVELQHFARRRQLFLISGYLYLDRRLFQLGIGHLRSHRPLPDQFVKLLPFFFLDRGGLCVGWANCLVSLLSGFVLILELSHLVIPFAIKAAHRLRNVAKRRCTQGNAVGTHVSDVPVFVKLLSDLHRPCDTVAKLS